MALFFLGIQVEILLTFLTSRTKKTKAKIFNNCRFTANKADSIILKAIYKQITFIFEELLSGHKNNKKC